MNAKKKKIELLCEEALEKIDEAILKHQRGEDADLSIDVLMTVREEVQRMKSILDVSVYKPGYPQFILDSWPDKHGLVKYLVDVAYQYERMAKGK